MVNNSLPKVSIGKIKENDTICELLGVDVEDLKKRIVDEGQKNGFSPKLLNSDLTYSGDTLTIALRTFISMQGDFTNPELVYMIIEFIKINLLSSAVESISEDIYRGAKRKLRKKVFKGKQKRKGKK